MGLLQNDKIIFTKLPPLAGGLFFKIFFLCILPLLHISCFAQDAQPQEGKKIQILNADKASYDSKIRSDAQMLIGNVQLMHREVLMTCDSALLYQAANRLEAFGNVRLNQGDTLHLYGDSLFYNGNNRMGRVESNVILRERDLELTTSSLLYDTKKSVGYYTTGGKITSRKNKNVLTSTRGTYASKLKTFYFKDQVKLENPEYTVNTDTMDYNSRTETAFFFGPTVIKSEENLLYAEDGWYNTKTDQARFKKNAYMVSGDQKLQGDSLFYDRKKGVGEVFRNIIITDTVNDFILYGNYGRHDENTNVSLITQSPRAIKIFESDSLFLRADTIYALEDSLGINTLLAHHKVRFFKPDMQGASDTLIYAEKDSSLTLINDPVVWSEENQLTGRQIVVYNDGNEARELYIDKDANIIQLVDTTYNQFNQLQGRELRGYFKANELRVIYITGNGQSIYYAQEDKADGTKELVGINKAECSDITITLNDSKIQTITFSVQPVAVTLPPEKVGSSELLLKGFRWEAARRPENRDEIMNEKGLVP